MQPDVVCRTVEQHPHRLLRTPHSLVLVVHFNALFLPLYLKDEELRRTVFYFSTLCHILNKGFVPFSILFDVLLYQPNSIVLQTNIKSNHAIS